MLDVEAIVMAKGKTKKPIPLSILRQSRGLTQKELCEELHVSNGLIGLYETGKRKPRLERALEIANFFGTSVELIQFDCRNVN
jgi:transcriptional regulator with XRE-family HTH domain